MMRKTRIESISSINAISAILRSELVVVLSDENENVFAKFFCWIIIRNKILGPVRRITSQIGELILAKARDKRKR